jgi:hypothetical protein
VAHPLTDLHQSNILRRARAARGYVTSLARPSGNVTGVFFQQIELAAKRIQLVKDAFPFTRRRAYSFSSFL